MLADTDAKCGRRALEVRSVFQGPDAKVGEILLPFCTPRLRGVAFRRVPACRCRGERNRGKCSYIKTRGAVCGGCLERAMGIEPTTYSLGSCRSTTELRPQSKG